MALSQELSSLAQQVGAYLGRSIVTAYVKSGKRRKATFDDLWIRPKAVECGLIKLQPNEVQEHYLDTMAEDSPSFQWRSGVYVLSGIRHRILKARQEGMSTIINAICFLNVVNTPHTRAVVIAQDEKAAETLFEMNWLYYENLDKELRLPLRRGNKGEIYFDYPHNSRIYIGTANRVTIGRGATIQYLHMSERAQWELDPTRLRKLDAGVKQAVPTGGNIWEETTANGLNWFYDDYQEAKSEG